MAVYERAYKTYSGPLTPEWSRFAILPRFAFRRVFASRLFLAFFVLCFAPPVVGLAMIYIANNLKLLEALGIRVTEMQLVDAGFFFTLMTIQCQILGFVLTLVVGPRLISTDAAHNAMPLYFARPFTRNEYVLGKLTVLVVLLSAITWVPLVLLFATQAYFAGGGWLADNLRIGAGVLVGCWIWLLTMALAALAISASVKRAATAGIGLFGLFFILAAFGQILSGAIGFRWGDMLNLPRAISRIWAAMLGMTPPDMTQLPVPAAWLAVLGFWGICLWVLARKVRAYEIVK